MTISSNAGSSSCPSFEEYETLLKACFSSGEGGEIWCASEEGGYPCLSILINGEQAVVNYFAEEGGEMFASFGDGDTEEPVKFCGGQYETAGYQVISSSAALEFFRSQERPDCIEWEEL